MIRRLFITAAALVAATQAPASPQTHELMNCYRSPFHPSRGILCYGVDDEKPLYENAHIQALYQDGWRLIAVEKFSNGNTGYWLERPIGLNASSNPDS